jgi:transcriptional regulator with XRE-family HTH domain
MFASWEDLADKKCPEVFAAEHVVAVRKLMGWSQADLARKLGRERQAVWRWEHGRTNISKVDSLAIRFAVIYDDIV